MRIQFYCLWSACGHNISECEHPRRTTTPGTTAKETSGERESQTHAELRLTAIGQHLPFFVVLNVSCESQSASVDPPVEPLLHLQSHSHTLYNPLLSLSLSLSLLSFSHQLLFPGYSLLFIPRILVLFSIFTVTARLRVLSVVLSSSSPPDNNFPPA